MTELDRVGSTLLADHRLASLAARHAGLEQAIAEEWERPAPDTLCLTALKRRKLHVKEEIVRHRRRARLRQAG